MEHEEFPQFGNQNGNLIRLSRNEAIEYSAKFAEKYSQKEIKDFILFYSKIEKRIEGMRLLPDDEVVIDFSSTSPAKDYYELYEMAMTDDIKISEHQMFVLLDVLVYVLLVLHLSVRNHPYSQQLNHKLQEMTGLFHRLLMYDRWVLNNLSKVEHNENKGSIENPIKRFINYVFHIKIEDSNVGGAVQLHRRAQVTEQNRRAQMTEGMRRLEDEQNLQPIDRLYDSILDESNFAPNDINRKLLKKKLNVKPLKSKWMVYENGFYWMADTKVFGRDIISNGEVGILVCVDASTRRCDAEPVMNVAQMDCIPAFYKILDRHIIQQGMPTIVMTDQGGEFGQRFTDYCNRMGIKHRVSFAGRKEQTSIAEHTIGLISFGLMANLYQMRVNNRNYNQGPKPVTAVDFLADGILPRIVNKINKWASSHYPKPTSEWWKLDHGESETDLKAGDLVLVKNIKTDRIKKRYGQHDYTNRPFQIIRVYHPAIKGEPFRFLTTYSNGKPPVTFKRDELIKYDDYEHNNPIIEFA